PTAPERHRRGLLVAFSEGGVTPGDSYLWLLDDNGRPTAWRMWVNIIPIPGVEISWEGWQQLSTGAWVASLHHSAIATLPLEAIKGTATLAELEPGPDPFEALVRHLGDKAPPSTAPASMPSKAPGM
ncbi:MAG: hypothetical protein AAFX99_11600, partial [Myxococcota bacterium]